MLNTSYFCFNCQIDLNCFGLLRVAVEVVKGILGNGSHVKGNTVIYLQLDDRDRS